MANSSEFYKEDTSSSAVLASAGLPSLWNFDQVVQKLAFIFFLQFVLSATFLFDYFSKFSGL